MAVYRMTVYSVTVYRVAVTGSHKMMATAAPVETIIGSDWLFIGYNIECSKSLRDGRPVFHRLNIVQLGVLDRPTWFETVQSSHSPGRTEQNSINKYCSRASSSFRTSLGPRQNVALDHRDQSAAAVGLRWFKLEWAFKPLENLILPLFSLTSGY
ncbi:hypothetical protein RRG08_052073 [Elysia crispata]|uniref:Uncharacterized protein n=1 Tax=Elysia crispata TaxID=231223 RepID=A0AAE1DSA9_9GAST|nr:hypothetical protein RRG08_052073 [Elysia crispata]